MIPDFGNVKELSRTVQAALQAAKSMRRALGPVPRVSESLCRGFLRPTAANPAIYQITLTREFVENASEQALVQAVLLMMQRSG